MIEPLECRRMLTAIFNGGDGADTIVIRRGTDGVTHVQINGGAVQDTSDTLVIVRAHGGSDSVYFPELHDANVQPSGLSIELGDGNDLASNYNPVTQIAPLDAIDFRSFLFVVGIHAGAGNDTLELDGSDGIDARDFTFAPEIEPLNILRLSLPGSSEFKYYADLETCVIEGTPSGDYFDLDHKLDKPRLIFGQSGEGARHV